MNGWLGAAFLVVGFVTLIRLLRLPQHAASVGDEAKESLAVVRNASMSDDAKEAKLQAHALRLFRLGGILLAGGLFALLAPAAAETQATRW